MSELLKNIHFNASNAHTIADIRTTVLESDVKAVDIIFDTVLKFIHPAITMHKTIDSTKLIIENIANINLSI